MIPHQASMDAQSLPLSARLNGYEVAKNIISYLNLSHLTPFSARSSQQQNLAPRFLVTPVSPTLLGQCKNCSY